MALSIQDATVVHVYPDSGKKYVNDQHRRLELELEVANLQKMLENEEKVHEILERALLPCASGSMLQIPSFLPKKAKELLAELVMVEEEIARLEGEISKIHQDIKDEKEARERDTPRSVQHDHSSASIMAHPDQVTRTSSLHEKVTMETKPMFFINQAIKGDYTMHGFTSTGKDTSTKKENQKVGGFQERVQRKSGMIENSISSPKLSPRPPAPRLLKQRSEISTNLLKDSPTNPHVKKCSQIWQPNKLSERIVKCLICIFQRLLRTTRTTELEKSGNLSRSLNSSLISRSLRIEGSLNPKANHATQKDPYGIFDIEDSILRDIGPYKNLVRFTTNSLDIKGLSTSLPLLKQLKDLLYGLQELDLRFLNHQQKLAFWINMHNACIMHGFIEHGLPSDPEKLVALKKKAVLKIGSNKLNASAIENFILKQPSNAKEVTLKADKHDREDSIRKIYGLEHPEPNIAFALCCGSKSSPAVRIYTSECISAELEKAKLEYLQASIVVTTTRRLMIPKLLLSNMSEFAENLVEWICNQLPTSWSLRKSIVECLKGNSNGKISDILDVLPYDTEFQYLLPM